MVNLITTLGGWTLVAVIGCTYWWRYKNEKARRQGPPAKAEREQVPGRDRRRVEATAEVDSGAEKQKQRRKDKPKPSYANAAATGSSSATEPAAEPAPEPSSRRKDADDMAFARQLASTQQGTSLKAAETQTGKVRTNKIRSQESLRDADTKWQSSGPGSSAGADGDDGDEDASSQASPNLAASADTGRAHGISDMLEAPAPGPMSLRVVASEKPQRAPKAAAAKKPAQEPETKKQRQRRIKRETEKAQLADDEAQRRTLMERQMKTARTLDGTAKSGVYRPQPPPPAGAAWKTAGSGKAGVKTDGQPLLDTFDPHQQLAPKAADAAELADPPSDASRASLESEPRSSGPGSANGGYQHDPVIADTSAPSGRFNDWEDYQMRSLKDQDKGDSEWQEVAPRKGKKAVK